MYSWMLSSNRNLQTKSNDYQTNLSTQKACTCRICQSPKPLNKKTAKRCISTVSIWRKCLKRKLTNVSKNVNTVQYIVSFYASVLLCWPVNIISFQIETKCDCLREVVTLRKLTVLKNKYHTLVCLSLSWAGTWVSWGVLRVKDERCCGTI